MRSAKKPEKRMVRKEGFPPWPFGHQILSIGAGGGIRTPKSFRDSRS